MAGDPRLYTPRASLFDNRGSLFTPGYTPIPRLRRVLEDGTSARVLENTNDYRVAERNAVLAE